MDWGGMLEEKIRNWAIGAIHPDFWTPMHSTRPRAERDLVMDCLQ